MTRGRSRSQPLDLTAEAFISLRSAFFNEGAAPREYPLRPKQSTQDDPFDEYVHRLLSERLPQVQCVRAPGPLISPDLVLLRPEACNGASRQALRSDLHRIVALEVKKLERTSSGSIARASGLDYNTTPPCGTVRVYDRDKRPLDIRGFYLFVCQEAVPEREGFYRVTGLVLCDGNLLNADFDLYLEATGQRRKKIGLGSYGDGVDRTRPMFIFANPLGVPQLDRHATLVHPSSDLEQEFPRLRCIGTIRRTIREEGEEAVFYCYRLQEDVSASFSPFDLLDPFPQPKRTERTQRRGRFIVDISPSE